MFSREDKIFPCDAGSNVIGIFEIFTFMFVFGEIFNSELVYFVQ